MIMVVVLLTRFGEDKVPEWEIQDQTMLTTLNRLASPHTENKVSEGIVHVWGQKTLIINKLNFGHILNDVKKFNNTNVYTRLRFDPRYLVLKCSWSGEPSLKLLPLVLLEPPLLHLQHLHLYLTANPVIILEFRHLRLETTQR